MPFSRMPLFLVLSLFAYAATAQPRLVRNINENVSPVSSTPGGYTTIGNVTYFFADDQVNGNELWKTDGTEAGTVLVRNIGPDRLDGIGRTMSVPRAWVAGGKLFFVAAGNGPQLWVSDGTSEGTLPLGSVTNVSGGGQVPFPMAAGSLLYYTATTAANGNELWRTDGTPAGTRMLADLNPGAGHSASRALGHIGALLVFRAFDGTATRLYVTDGTTQGTRSIGTWQPGWNASLPDAVLFTISDAATQTWSIVRTDGTAEGTAVVRGGFTGLPSSQPFAVAGSIAYFPANDGATGTELWRTDGTAAGTYLVADVTPGAEGSPLYALMPAGEGVFFTKETPVRQLWFSDGSAGGTRLLKDVPSATAGVVSGSTYYFGSTDGTHGTELWRSDGTPEGTMLVRDILPGIESGLGSPWLVARPEGVFFAGNGGETGVEPWISDGTASGTRLLKNVAADSGNGSFPDALANVGGTLFFSAGNEDGTAIWTTNGTDAGTVRVATVLNDALYWRAGASSGGLYYYASGKVNEAELWRSDGTAAGTFRLFGGTGWNIIEQQLLPLRGGLYFGGDDTQHGTEPWFTDGSVAGTRMIGDMNAGPDGSAGRAAAAGELVYYAGVSGFTEGPWRTDGTAAGTRPLMDVPEHEGVRETRGFTRIGNHVFFVSYVHDQEFILWRSNAGTGETVPLDRIEDRMPQSLWNVGGQLVFMTRDRLWRSDGTPGGTMLVRDQLTPLGCFERPDFVLGDGVLYWYGVDELGVAELWRTDASAAGTFRLGRFEGPSSEGTQQCSEHDLHFDGGRLYFLGNDPLHGAEPWVSDGTVAGTRLLHDVNPGAAPSDPAKFLTVANKLYFTAHLPDLGRELWVMPLGGMRRDRSVRH